MVNLFIECKENMGGGGGGGGGEEGEEKRKLISRVGFELLTRGQ